MKKLTGILFIGAASIVCQAAQASVYDVTFANGTSPVFSFVTTTGDAQSDTFRFTTTVDSTFSGTIATQRLRVPADTGAIVSDLNFVSAVLDNTARFTDVTAGDTFEQLRLASTDIMAGAHTLLVTYNVPVASADQAASYGGVLNIAANSAVPEPASWAMFMGGFGMIGSTLRRKRTRTAVSFG